VDKDENSNIVDIRRELNIKFPLYESVNLIKKVNSFNGKIIMKPTPMLLFINNNDGRIGFVSLPKRQYENNGNFFDRVGNYLNNNNLE